MKIYLDTIGCRLNQAEIERYAAQFRAAGHTIVESAAEADIVVINTCAVTREAASDSRQKVRQAAHVGNAKIVLTGCWSSLEPQIAAEMPHTVRVIPNEEKDGLVSRVLENSEPILDLELIARQPLPGAHQRTRAFIKVQDGCDNFCTFCITRLARGKAWSVPLDTILTDIQVAIAGGTHEIVLSGVHLGFWGKDCNSTLKALIKTILDRTSVERVRLSSLEPWGLGEDFFDLWSNPRMCRHLHLPLQSGSAEILKRMARKTTPEEYLDIVRAARAAAPDIALTTDIIVGFPGETDADFQQTLELVRTVEYAGGHVFSFSPRPGTPAARFPDPVDMHTRKQRSSILRALLAEQTRRYQQKFIGTDMQVLWEADKPDPESGWLHSGLTDNYLRVQMKSPRKLWNTISCVHLDGIEQDTILGTIVA